MLETIGTTHERCVTYPPFAGCACGTWLPVTPQSHALLSKSGLLSEFPTMSMHRWSGTLRHRVTVVRLALSSATVAAVLALPWAPAQAQTVLNRA